MTGGPARIVMIMIGAFAVVVGLIWIGQGLNLIPGSFMTGDRTWLVIGLVLFVAGVVVLVRALRRPTRRR
jgi:NhaP-type Na+/H+ or K+/H+ antiporter